jgi:hypothetical protein
LDDDAAVFLSLQASSVFRSFPVQDELTPSAVTALRRALKSGWAPFNLEDEGMRLCFKKGWVHVESTNNLGLDQWFFIPSRLHEK